MNPVVNFELPYEDRDRAAKFYQDAFGWKPNLMGENMGNNVVMQTTEVDPNTHFPTQPGRINGGLFQKDPNHATPSVVIAVDDIHEAIKKATSAGAKNFQASKPGEPDLIPNVGWYISFTDTEGNTVSLLQPNPM